MYAIETKKRKFDRILNSIQDHSASQSNSSLPPRNNTHSTISLITNDQSTTAAKKLRLSSGTSTSKNDSTTSLASQKTANYLPTSREAFLERLQTFGPITKWHIASNEVISAAAWARRGWRCVGTDTVSCGACEGRLLVKLDKDEERDISRPREVGDVEQVLDADAGDEDNDYAMASEIHAGIVSKYEELITSAHNETCPWRRRGCIDSIQRIEGLLNAPTAISGLQIRYEGMVGRMRGSDVPSVCISDEEFERYATPFQSILSKISTMNLEGSNKSAYLLGVCGWQTAIEHGNDVVECRYCFRRLGLWLYRGNEPAMEKLDAIDSHLEYCPWRSPEAQSTEISFGGTKVMVPGWVLVAQAVQRQKVDTFADAPRDTGMGPEAPSLQEEAIGSVAAKVGENERETKVKDLLRRVKELKKPFNVKALLKRNKKLT